jgi:hypothetical protein
MRSLSDVASSVVAHSRDFSTLLPAKWTERLAGVLPMEGFGNARWVCAQASKEDKG